MFQIAQVHLHLLDMSKPRDVIAFADSFVNDNKQLNVLVGVLFICSHVMMCFYSMSNYLYITKQLCLDKQRRLHGKHKNGRGGTRKEFCHEYTW